MIEEKELENKLPDVIKNIYADRSFLDEVIQCQSQYTDKNVYQNIDKALEEIINEKN